MKIYGFNKLTLLDYPGKIACELFTGACDFRCPFCQNAALVLHPETEEIIEETKILEYLNRRKNIVEGICITGGEPTLQHDLPEFIKNVKNMGYAVKLDTNGNHPKVLKKLLDERLLDYVAMDIKNSREKYALSTGISHFNTEKVELSASLLMQAQIPFEFRTTVIAEHHEMNDFTLIGKWLKGAKLYYLQYFRDSGNLISDGLHAFSPHGMEEAKNILEDYVEKVGIRGETDSSL